MCEVACFKNFENSLTTVKVMTKTKVAPFYLGHGVVTLLIDLPRLGAATPAGLADRPSALRSVCLHSGIFV